MVNVVPREVPRSKPSGPVPQALRPLGFWPWDLPRHNIHHDTSSAFSNNVPLHRAWTWNIARVKSQYTSPG